MSMDDLLDNRQPQTRAFSLGRRKEFKDIKIVTVGYSLPNTCHF
jgi:hypothetical protein